MVAEFLIEEETLDRTMWGTSYGWSYGLIFRETTEWI